MSPSTQVNAYRLTVAMHKSFRYVNLLVTRHAKYYASSIPQRVISTNQSENRFTWANCISWSGQF